MTGGLLSVRENCGRGDRKLRLPLIAERPELPAVTLSRKISFHVARQREEKEFIYTIPRQESTEIKLCKGALT